MLRVKKKKALQIMPGYNIATSITGQWNYHRQLKTLRIITLNVSIGWK